MVKNDWQEHFIELYEELYIFNARLPFKICDQKMIKLISFRSLLSLGVAALLSQAVLADEGLTPAETNTMVKENIASAQVMLEVCPVIIGKNAKFDQNIHKMVQSYLQDHSDSSVNFDKIQSDSEYQSILAEARQDAKETNKDEQKSVCDDVLNYEA